MTISIDPELQARLQRIAATTDRSASAVVRLAVTSFLEAEK